MCIHINLPQNIKIIWIGLLSPVLASQTIEVARDVLLVLYDVFAFVVKLRSAA
ncbi:hypothetical protein [Bartonella sp. B30(2025)]